LRKYEGFHRTDDKLLFRFRGLVLGLGSQLSIDDISLEQKGLHTVTFVTRGELQSPSSLSSSLSSHLSAINYSAITATHFILAQRAAGVPREDCVVSVVGTNAMTIIFGATILLCDTFPTFIPLSKQLDLLDDRENKIASAFLDKAVENGEILSKLKRGKEMKITNICLDVSKYFVKRYTQEVFDRGLGLFTRTGLKTDIQDGFFNLNLISHDAMLKSHIFV
jgi:hypothetical protein